MLEMALEKLDKFLTDYKIDKFVDKKEMGVFPSNDFANLKT
jgi:hypothetical protein